MKDSKKVLLIAGGGTLGSNTQKELLKKGVSVDVICLEDKQADDDRLTFYRENASYEFLQNFLKDRYYDGIVNFIHYIDVEAYKPVHELLTQHTDQLIFLSSYRVYADSEHPIKETSPKLADTLDDEDFFKNEKYALCKSKAEKYIVEESKTSNWTIIRPVISFSERRLDLVSRSGTYLVDCAKQNKVVTLPKNCKNLTAGLDWAGNTGKIIANLLFKEKALGEAFTVSSAQNLKWGEVADIYSELLGLKFKWVELDEYIAEISKGYYDAYLLKYDRLYDRVVDNEKVLCATGLKKEDFTPIKDGIREELLKLCPDLLKSDKLN